ncbi:MAG: hypothetical protein ACREDD_12625 [Methylocella sp.]
MSDFNQLSFLAGLIGFGFGLIIAWRDWRVRAAVLRINGLKSARKMLERHHKALAILDDDDTPEEVLYLAIRFAKLIQNPALPKAIAYILSENPQAFRIENGADKQQNERLMAVLMKTRFDLIEALVTSIIAGMAAVVGRWPECRGAFDDILVDIAASPVRETGNILDIMDKAISYLSVTRMAPAH